MQRILYIDILKLFTIFLVIWGHAIQHFQPDYEHSYIFRIIYAFHMPLFMMLSGYFATSSMSLEYRVFFPKKFRQLLLPCLSWAVVCWLIITSGLIDGKFHIEIKTLFTGWLGIIDNFWFLKSCFICYSLSWLCCRCGRHKVVIMVVLWGLCTMQGRFHLDMMFPTFLLGMYLRKKMLENKLNQYRYLLYGFFVILLSVNFLISSREIYIFRLILGISGASACFILFQSTIGKLQPTPFLERLACMGGTTLGIYVLQAILLESLLPRYISFATLTMPMIVVLMPLLSLVMLLVLYSIIRVINRSKLMGCLMFGRAYTR